MIVCIPDTIDSFEFLEAAKKFQLPLLLLIKEKWLQDIRPFSWDYLIVDDFEKMEHVALAIEHKLPKQKISECIAFAESNIELAGYLNSRFATHGLKQDQAELFRDKYLMKRKANALGLSTPLFGACVERRPFYEKLQKMSEASGKPFVLLVKPRKSWGCQGIKKFSSIEMAEKHIETLPSPNDYLLEEYLEAEMFHVGGVVREGQAVLSVVVKHDASLFEMGRSAPEHLILHTIDQHSEEASRLKKAHDVIVEGFGLKDGLTFVEFFKEIPTGKISLCEAAARHPALHVPKLYQIVTGKNFFEEYARVLAKNCIQDDPARHNSYAGIISFAALPGRLVAVDSIDAFDDPEIIYKTQPKGLLGTTFEHVSFKNTIGQIIIKTKEESRCTDLLQSYARKFKYRVS